MIVLLLTAGLLYFAITYFLKIKEHHQSCLNNVPGPPPTFIVGNLFDLKSSAEVLPTLLNFYYKYGGVFKLRVGPIRYTVILCEPKSIGFILGSPKYVEKSNDYEFIKAWLGAGLLTSPSQLWKNQRKILTPTFHFKILEDFVDVFNSSGDVLIQKIEKNVGGESFDIYPYMNLCTLDVICETAMGVSIKAQKRKDSEYVKSVNEMCEIVSKRSFSLLQRVSWLYRLTKTYKKEQKLLNVMHGFTNSVISQRRKEAIKYKENKEQENCDEYGIKSRKAFLDLLLETKDANGNHLSDQQIREQVDTFMFGGNDTTSTALSFVTYCLAQNPDVQEKAADEVLSVLGNDTSKYITFQDLQSMPYLEMVIKETLRLYPSAPYFSRKSEDDVDYEGVTIPKGTEIGIASYLVHRNPEIYPDPEKFDPERFAEAVCRPPYSYIPFSAGPRNCIGQKFAMTEMKTLLAKLLQSYIFLPAEPDHKLLLVYEMVLKSRNGVNLRVKCRQPV